MAALFKKYFQRNDSSADVDVTVVKDKNAQVGEEVFVDGVAVYQDASGAPIENVSPLGYHVRSWMIALL